MHIKHCQMGLYTKSCPLVGQTLNFTKYFLRYEKKLKHLAEDLRRHWTNCLYLRLQQNLDGPLSHPNFKYGMQSLR
jgi:hypothetical protein